jgi:hypothetical protein
MKEIRYVRWAMGVGRCSKDKGAWNDHRKQFVACYYQPRTYMNILVFVILLFSAIPMRADEGMWIPCLLDKYKFIDMQQKGLKLSAEDIYSINQASLKDAVVMFGRGCTGAIVSDKGLLLTNHHCGFGRIQAHSSLEHDYITDGFWAMNKEEELSNPGLTVSFLIRMEDVTDRVLAVITAGMTEQQRNASIEEAGKKIIDEATKDTHYEASVRSLFSGNQYFLYVMEVYKDIRLVGAPPFGIGSFGGDTDNWVWPRHTGDFSIFRIYAGPDNQPAEYSKDNVPYKPKKFLEISLKGTEKGDFTMVYGFPGGTSEYLPSVMIGLISQVSNPKRIEIRQEKLDIIGADMDKDPAVRIKYASKYAGIANAWKKWIGVDKGLMRVQAVENKRAFEQEFQVWAEQPVFKEKYGNVLPEFNKLVDDIKPLTYWIDNYSEAIWQMDIIQYAAGFRKLASPDQLKPDELVKETDRLKNGVQGFFKDYNQPTDKKLFMAMLMLFYKSVEPAYRPDIYKEIEGKFRGDFSKYSDWVYQKSFLVSEDRTKDFLDSYKPSKNSMILKDPVYIVMKSFNDYYTRNYADKYSGLLKTQDSLQRIYMAGLMEMQANKVFYPDANSTLRIAYGQVEDYFPQDGVRYDYRTTLAGIMEKDDPSIYDYKVPQRLHELYEQKDYGRYGKDGEIYVCFIASNHTSGGNSGSPVLDADGRLIGLNFDRDWEGTMSDIMYDPSVCRNISLDIRYCLFIIDKFAGAKNLVEEMVIRE